jgi:hypothetical protein
MTGSCPFWARQATGKDAKQLSSRIRGKKSTIQWVRLALPRCGSAALSFTLTMIAVHLRASRARPQPRPPLNSS